MGADAGGSLRNSWRPEIAGNNFSRFRRVTILKHTQTQNQTHWIQTNWKPTNQHKNKDIQTNSFHHIIQQSNQPTNKQTLVISLFQEAGRQTFGSEDWTADVDTQFESRWVAQKPRASCSILVLPTHRSLRRVPPTEMWGGILILRAVRWTGHSTYVWAQSLFTLLLFPSKIQSDSRSTSS